MTAWLVGWIATIVLWVGLPVFGSVCLLRGASDLWDHIALAQMGVPSRAKVVSLDFRVDYDDGRHARYDLVFWVEGADRASRPIAITEQQGRDLSQVKTLEMISLPARPHVARWKEAGPGPLLSILALLTGVLIWALWMRVVVAARRPNSR